jgi:hypothetical protein
MVTHVSNARSYETNHPAIHTPVAWKKQRIPLLSGRRVLKWFGMISTGLISSAALAPHAFGVPTDLQPWVFVTSIFWFLAFCAGMFDL